MGQKTKKERRGLFRDLEIQMNLAADLASRNPRMRALEETYPNRFVNRSLKLSPEELSTDQIYHREYDTFFNECYGEVFPTYSFPVLQLDEGLKEFKRDPSGLFLRIDLNYTKDEIMLVVEDFVEMRLRQYKKNRTLKHKRKSPKKWMAYLEIWDLKNGDPPWVEFSDGFKQPLIQKEKKAGHGHMRRLRNTYTRTNKHRNS